MGIDWKNYIKISQEHPGNKSELFQQEFMSGDPYKPSKVDPHWAFDPPWACQNYLDSQGFYDQVYGVFRLMENGQFLALSSHNEGSTFTWLADTLVVCDQPGLADYLNAHTGGAGFVYDLFAENSPVRVNWGKWMEKKKLKPHALATTEFVIVD